MTQQTDQAGQVTNERVIACHECDLLVTVSELEPGSVAVCPRCDYVIFKHHKNALERLLAFSVSGLIFLLMSSLYPFLSFSASGQQREVTLLQSLDVLAGEQEILLAFLIMVVILIIPAVFLLGVVYVMGHLKYHGTLPVFGRRLLRIILGLAPWSMVEIFLIGTLVSLVKISSMALITLGLSFWAYILFTIFMTLVLFHLDKVQIWEYVEAGDRAHAI